VYIACKCKEKEMKCSASVVHIYLIFLLYFPTTSIVGTTRATAGSAAKFVTIDRDYVLAAAKAAVIEKSDTQRIVYCSSAMASSKARFLYPQSKGLTEEGLGEY
jgi:hypothetical protein